MRIHADPMLHRSLRPLSIALAFAPALALAGCGSHTTELGPSPEPVQSAQPAPAEPAACRPAAALLAPQSAPDCSFDQAHLGTIDPLQWSRLRIEYEKKCYQSAEKVARERLRLLQAANKCQIASR